MDDSHLEDLVERAAAGDASSWSQLWRELEPWLDKVISSPRFLGALGQRDDDRGNIVLEVMARLHADNCRRLAMYVEMRKERRQLAFKPWLRVVAKRVGIDYQRAQGSYIDMRRDPERGSTPGMWVQHTELPSHSRLPGERPPVTRRGMALELLRYAADHVPEAQLAALELWTQSAGYDEIARELGLASSSEAERMVRAAIERLRRRFRGEASDE